MSNQKTWYGNIYSMLPELFAKFHRNRLTLGTRDPWGLLPYRISLASFNTHLYVVGRSGQGKSKYLQHLLFELTTKGWGCGVLDPHSDLANDCLAYLYTHHDPSYMSRPFLEGKENLAKVVYVEPSRTDYVLPANILKCSYATSYEVAENVVEAFRRVWPETLSEAPRFSQIMRNAILVLAQSGLSLVELERFLTDEDFRSDLLAGIRDPMVVSFFQQQYNRWGRERILMASPVLNKVSAFLFQPQVRASLGAQENRLDLRRIIDEGRILIINLGGFNDAQTQRLLGSLIVTSLERAAFSRRDQPAHARRPYYFLIDEFPAFCSRDQTTLARILSECRKFRIHLGLAHQTVTQIPGERLQGALENAKLKVIFGTGRQTAETIVKQVFSPDTRQIKHEVADEQQRERTHPMFESLFEQWENTMQKIQGLKQRQIIVQPTEGAPLVCLKTPTVYKQRCSEEQLNQLKRYLVARDGVCYSALKRNVNHRLQNPSQLTREQVGYYEYA